MDINPELVARAYAIYEFYLGLTEEVESAEEGSFRMPSPAIKDDDLSEFLARLKELDDDEDSEGGGDTLKGLRGDEQMREARALTMDRGRRPM